MATKFNERMDDFFGIENEEIDNLPETREKNLVFFGTLDDDLKNDYEKSREDLDDLIEKGKSAVDDILTIARETEKGRDFEVAATMLKTVIDANEKRLQMHKTIREIYNYQQKEESKTNIKNAIFVGSTKDLAKMVKDINEKDVIEGN